MAHSTVVGGSSASRVLNCPASVKLAELVPPAPGSPYAMEGTALHYVMEQWLLHETPLADFVGAEVEGVTITQELIDGKAQPALDATEEAFTRFDVDEFEPEAEVHFTTIPGAFGTCDIFARGRDDLVVLLDYKFGSGVLVSPVENKQLMFYAAAAMEDPQFKDWWTGDLDQPIALGIIQPAQDHALTTWMTTVREVTVFSVSLSMAVDSASKGGGDPRPGEWCRWCPAAAVCPAKARDAKKALAMDPARLNDLSEAMHMADDLEAWVKRVRAMTHEQLERGDNVEGFKLVKSRASRKWVDAEGIEKKLKNMRKLVAKDYEIAKLVTPPQLEKVCKAKGVDFKQFAEYYDMVSSGTAVVPASDPREGIVKREDREIPEGLADLMDQT